MKQQFLLTIFCCCITVVFFGQAKVAFTAQTNAKKVVKGGFFQVVFQVENGALDDFKPPKFEGFQIVSGPNRSSEISIVNGKRSQAAKISYGLSASKIGEFKIGSASVTLKGKTYKTKPLTIKVVKGSDKKLEYEQQFAVFEVDETTAYVGQQIVGTIKVYALDRILNADLLNLPEIENTYSEPFAGQSAFRRGVDVINGKQYNTLEIQKYAIFPQKAGEIRIEPINVYLETLGNQSGFMQQLRFNLLTEPINLKIKKVENKPEKFSEGVGKYNFSAVLNKEKLSTDETATLVLNIIGTGDMKRILPLELEQLKEDFELYEPTIETQSAMQNGMMIYQKLITYVLAPKRVGRFEFTQAFTYFDTDVENYITLKSDTFNIEVTQGKKVEATAKDFSQQDIYPIITTGRSYFNRNFFETKLFWMLFMLPFIILIILLIIRNRKAEKDKSELTLNISEADKIALARLEQAKVYLEQRNQRLFYNEINQSLFRYISDKFSIPFSELSKDNIRLRLEQQEIETVIIDKFIRILNICELALFAGIGKTEDMDSAYLDAKAVIVEIEK